MLLKCICSVLAVVLQCNKANVISESHPNAIVPYDLSILFDAIGILDKIGISYMIQIL